MNQALGLRSLLNSHKLSLAVMEQPESNYIRPTNQPDVLPWMKAEKVLSQKMMKMKELWVVHKI